MQSLILNIRALDLLVGLIINLKGGSVEYVDVTASRLSGPGVMAPALTIVLQKPSKPNYSDPEAWCPIVLLSTIEKIMEAVMAQRLSDFAEQHRLLSDSQMEN
jgi:hypothetical protein